jgi:hypothetical protein
MYMSVYCEILYIYQLILTESLDGAGWGVGSACQMPEKLLLPDITLG